VEINMEDLSLHILDIVENSLAASASRVEIVINEDTEKDLLSLEIRDNGTGMDPETKRKALDPFFTTKKARRVGLGLPLLAQAARDSEGEFEIQSEPGKGTVVKATFKLSHPDRKPLGDIVSTLETLLTTNPELELRFEYRKNSEIVAELDTRSTDEGAKR